MVYLVVMTCVGIYVIDAIDASLENYPGHCLCCKWLDGCTKMWLLTRCDDSRIGLKICLCLHSRSDGHFVADDPHLRSEPLDRYIMEAVDAFCVTIYLFPRCLRRNQPASGTRSCLSRMKVAIIWYYVFNSSLCRVMSK